MNPCRLTPFLAGLCACGLLLGTTACSPNRPATGIAPAMIAADTPASRTIQPYNLATDTYFGFGKATLDENGKAKLDLLVGEIPGKHNPRIQITGYADRLGDARSNLRLAQRRAEAVRDYLISRGVEPATIEVTALGTHDPLVNCTGRTGEALIECLGPNRRTVVEFSAFEIREDGAQTPAPEPD